MRIPLLLVRRCADRYGIAAQLTPLRYPASCAKCGSELAPGKPARWDRERKTATCGSCLTSDSELTIDRGQAGVAAARERKRRHERRETRTRKRYGKLGGLVLAVTEDPHSTSAWAYGARGERALGAFLDPLRDEGIAVLHDRRIPGSRANIDHVVVSAAGVFVIDAKNYQRRVEYRDRGGWFSVDERLYVGGRDKTSLVKGMAKQATAVRTALGGLTADVPVTQVICFVAAEWSLLARPFRFGDVHVARPGALVKLIHADGMLGPRVGDIERRLATALPAA